MIRLVFLLVAGVVAFADAVMVAEAQQARTYYSTKDAGLNDLGQTVPLGLGSHLNAVTFQCRALYTWGAVIPFSVSVGAGGGQGYVAQVVPPSGLAGVPWPSLPVKIPFAPSVLNPAGGAVTVAPCGHGMQSVLTIESDS